MGPDTRLIVENHYLGAVLDKFQFDTFYHEHPRTYSAHSFIEIAKKLNRNIESIEFPSRYGGNIRVFIGPNSPEKSENTNLRLALEREMDFDGKFDEMRDVIHRWQLDRTNILSKLNSGGGTVYAKAFPGRAAILIKLLGLSEKDISAVFEKPNSMKIGHYIPGTRIPILSEDQMPLMAPAPRAILNLAWHINLEIKSYVKSMDPLYDVVDIFSPERYCEKARE